MKNSIELVSAHKNSAGIYDLTENDKIYLKELMDSKDITFIEYNRLLANILNKADKK